MIGLNEKPKPKGFIGAFIIAIVIILIVMALLAHYGVISAEWNWVNFLKLIGVAK